MGNAGSIRNSTGGLFVIAGQHDHIQMQLLHSRNGGNRIGFQYIRRGNGAQIFLLLAGKVERGLALCFQFPVLRNGNAQFFHQSSVAAIVADTCNRCCHTTTGKGLKVFRCGRFLLADLSENRLGKGMLGFALQCGSNGHQTGFGNTFRQNIRHFRLAGGKRSGLIQHNSINMMQIL